MNKLIFVLICNLVFACQQKATSIEINNIEFIKSTDALKLGATKSEVILKLGNPNFKEKDSNIEYIENWYYQNNDEYKSQRALIEIDLRKDQLTYLMVVPMLTEPESKLDSLIKTKFKGLVFKSYPIKKCKKHYFPKEIFYTNLDEGIAIFYDSGAQFVNSYSKQSKASILDLIERIDKCKI